MVMNFLVAKRSAVSQLAKQQSASRVEPCCF